MIDGMDTSRDGLIRRIPADLRHDWSVTLNGKPVVAFEFVAVHGQLGALSWGLRGEGTVGWIWEETGGRGVGIVPYAVINQHLMIGIIQQERSTMPGGIAWNIPRGFLDPGLTHLEGAKSETKDELGFEQLTDDLKELPGEPANSNSTFFDTRAGNGFRYYGLHIPRSLLDCSQESPVFLPGISTPRSVVAERILQSRFVHWRDASRVADNFTNAGVARLIASEDQILQFL
jgi:hypothetical protein